MNRLTLKSVNVDGPVEIFRDLLWCHGSKHGVPYSKIHITSSVTTRDGGVDARIDGDVSELPSDLLVSSGTSFQIKTGTTFKPWQASQLKKELFGKTDANVELENLAPEVRRALENCSRYIVVSFGVDPTPEQISDGKQFLLSYFKQCGIEDPDVEIWGQTHLAGYIVDGSNSDLNGQAKFQFSVKYKLTNRSGLIFGYTQKSFWSLQETSQPFAEFNFSS